MAFQLRIDSCLVIGVGTYFQSFFGQTHTEIIYLFIRIFGKDMWNFVLLFRLLLEIFRSNPREGE